MPQSPTPGREVPFTRASERLPLSQVLKHHFQLGECQVWGQGSLSPPPAPLWLWPAMPPLQPPCPLHASSEDLRLCVGRPLHQWEHPQVLSYYRDFAFHHKYKNKDNSPEAGKD